MTHHLGPDLAALVDGELGQAALDRVLRHLAGCPACRAEVAAQRDLKIRLLGLSGSTPAPAADLAARLRAVADSGARPGGPRRPPAAPRGLARRRVPRAVVGGAVLALGLGAVLALGGPAPVPTRTAVDPASGAFLVDYAGTSAELPLPEPAGVNAAGLGR